MVVYADILIILNIIVDYFLLLLTSKFLRNSTSLMRQIAAAVLGGLSSLIIFLPEQPKIIQLLIYISTALLMTAVCFGIKPVKRYLRSTALLFAVACSYAGLMMAFWTLFHPHGMVINNSVVYFNISPLFLIVFSIISYFVVAILRKVLDRNAPLAQNCEIKLFADNQTIDITAIADTGNSMEDIFGMSEIIIADRAATEALFGSDFDTPQIKRRYRALPCNTVSGSELLDGYRCDKAYISHNGKTLELRNPILAVSKSSMGGDYSAIINPKILM